MRIVTPSKWASGWGHDENMIPFRLIDGLWIEQPPIGKTLDKPRCAMPGVSALNSELTDV